MTNPAKLCRCRHEKQHHHGGLGQCTALWCVCSHFTPLTRQIERLEERTKALYVALDMLERQPDGDWPRLEPPEQESLVAQIRKALGERDA
jgi:hypothetical protein